jgi:hypothetical protein
LRGAETNEQQLIQVLQSKAALMDKDAACVQLKRIGTARSVPALAALLTDEQLSQSARYALEAMTFKAILATHPSAGQKRLVLAGLAGIPDPGSLKLVEPMLEDAAVQAEAARAVIKLASALPDWTMALAALNKVLAVTQEPATRSDAQAAIKQLDTGAGFINAWQVAGPYREAGKDYTALFDTAFPLETSGTQDVNWRALAGADARRPGIMDLLKALGGQECVAYARASIHCDREQAA